MKELRKLLFVAVLTAMSLPLFSQDAIIIANYIKVKPGMQQDYLELEQAWKKIHKASIDRGIMDGWQLWRKMYTGTSDEYDYITLHWYRNFESTFIKYPEDLLEGIFTDEEIDALVEKAYETREVVRRQVTHRILEAENSKPTRYLVINRMHVEEDKVNEYVALEEEIWKPYHEVCIEAGFRTHWGLWREWPFNEGQSIFSTVDGFDTPEQIMSGEDLLSKVHPDMTWDEIDEKTSHARSIASVEVWELVDFVFGE